MFLMNHVLDGDDKIVSTTLTAISVLTQFCEQLALR
jgi:hypothetical protein